MTRMTRTAPVAAIVLLLAGCATAHTGSAATVHHYLDAKTLDEALSLLAPEYRLWFNARKGEGMDRAAAARMLTWDYALHPRHRVDGFEVRGNEVVARVHEDNDFSLLIGFPGWDSTSTYVVDDAGRIVSQLYVPREGQPEWRPYLDAPLVWLREHHPDALARIFPNGKLAQSAETAREWVTLLRAWRAATSQPDPTR